MQTRLPGQAQNLSVFPGTNRLEGNASTSPQPLATLDIAVRRGTVKACPPWSRMRSSLTKLPTRKLGFASATTHHRTTVSIPVMRKVTRLNPSPVGVVFTSAFGAAGLSNLSHFALLDGTRIRSFSSEYLQKRRDIVPCGLVYGCSRPRRRRTRTAPVTAGVSTTRIYCVEKPPDIGQHKQLKTRNLYRHRR